MSEFYAYYCRFSFREIFGSLVYNLDTETQLHTDLSLSEKCLSSLKQQKN